MLMPDEAEAIGLLALMLLTESRRPPRSDADGTMVRLADQARLRWDRDTDHRRPRSRALPAFAATSLGRSRSRPR